MRLANTLPRFRIRIARLLVASLASAGSAWCHGDHTPLYGGVVLSLTDHHVEAVLKPEGRYSLYFTDAAGSAIPATLASKVNLTILRPHQPPESISLRLGESGDGWVGQGTPVSDRQTTVRISYALQGQSYSEDILFFSSSTNPLFHIDWRTYPSKPQVGRPVKLSLHIENSENKSVTALDIVHEKPIHLLIVSTDLAEFYHIHPQLTPGGTFDVTHVFPYGGSYRLYADYTPHDSGGVVESSELEVEGPRRAAVKLTPDTQLTKTVGNLRVSLSFDKLLTAGTDLQLKFHLADVKTGAPVRDLQRYLGAWGHIMIVSEDLQDFIHAHPYDPAETPGHPSAQNPPVIEVATGFRRPGLYKLWIQFQRNSIVIPVPFVLKVSGKVEAPEAPNAPRDAVLVTVSSAGYDPARIDAKAGQPLKLAFYRPNAQNCGGVVTFPDLHLSQELPPGKTTVVTIVPRKTGPISFACKMGMLKGQLIVR
jgi:hypothetical protein